MSSGVKVREAECLKYVRRDSHGQVRVQGSIYILSPLLVSSPWCQVAPSVSLNTSQSLSILSLSSPAGVSGRPSFRTIIIISIKVHSPVPWHPCPPAPFTSLIFIYNAVSLPLFFPGCLFLGFSISTPLCLSATYSIPHQSGVSFCPMSFHRLLDIIVAGCGLLLDGVLWLKKRQQKHTRSNRNHGYLLPK